jgi:D-glycero-D-manno-heptose 1,7-bisphosphate phosphatase
MEPLQVEQAVQSDVIEAVRKHLVAGALSYEVILNGMGRAFLSVIALFTAAAERGGYREPFADILADEVENLLHYDFPYLVRQARTRLHMCDRVVHPLSQYKLILFDKDSTLTRCTVEDRFCPNRPEEWELIPGVTDILAQYDWSQVRGGICTNQGGIEYGYLTYDDAVQICEGVIRALWEEVPGITLRTWSYAIAQSNDQENWYRKPNSGMLEETMVFCDVEPHETLFVGDSESDRQAAYNAKCDFIWAADFFHWRVV